jgi:hypothetical protein
MVKNKTALKGLPVYCANLKLHYYGLICENGLGKISVADPGCLSRIQNSNKREGRKKFHKLSVILFLICGRKKIRPNFPRFLKLTQKIVTKLSKIWVWDPGSGKTYSESRIQGSKGTGSRIRIRNTG